MCASGWVSLSLCMYESAFVCAQVDELYLSMFVCCEQSIFKRKLNFKQVNFAYIKKAYTSFSSLLLITVHFILTWTKSRQYDCVELRCVRFFKSDSLNKRTNQRTTERTSAQAFVCRSSAALVFVIVYIVVDGCDTMCCAVLHCIFDKQRPDSSTHAHTHSLANISSENGRKKNLVKVG